MKKYKGVILVGIVCVALALAFFFDDAPPATTQMDTPEVIAGVRAPSPEVTPLIQHPPNPETAPEPLISEETEKKETQQSVDELICTLTVDCISVYNNMELLSSDKWELVPPQGIIYDEKTLVFTEGESVFDVLQREMVNNGIHFEYVHTPMYNSAYIEGIGNIYEFDCGSRSGWMYRVNGLKQNVGCSQYKLKPDDKIRVYYTCDYFEEQ